MIKMIIMIIMIKIKKMINHDSKLMHVDAKAPMERSRSPGAGRAFKHFNP